MALKVGVLGVCIAINIKCLTKGHIGRLARYRPLFKQHYRETVMMLNTTFNNISVISWRSVLVEETGVPGENHRPITNTNQ
jgi:hypothetical protein